MTKQFSYYHFAYCKTELNWNDLLKNVSSCIVYKDKCLDNILSQTVPFNTSSDLPVNEQSNTEDNQMDSNHSEGTQHDRTEENTINNDSTNSFYIISNEKVLNINVNFTNEYINYQDIENVIMSNEIVYIKGFLLLRRKKILINKLINSNSDNDFNDLSNKLNLDNWKYEFYHKKFLFKKMNKLISKNVLPTVYDIKRDHPLIVFFMNFLSNCFKLINKRIFSIIIIGDTKIGKSVCFKECLTSPGYIEYHNSMLEFSKCSNENKKIFRLLDDINWNTVDIMTLKTILNRNVASVDVKYSYGIIYPMINIFLMNKEDYLIFQKKYVDIWSFISNNVAIYPKQLDNSIEEEMNELYDSNKTLDSYLFNDIIDLNQFENEFDYQISANVHPNIYECIKSKLIDIKPYIYDNRQFIDLTSADISMIPNRQLIENEMIRKIKEVETQEKYNEKVKKVEKKPKLVTNHHKKSNRIKSKLNTEEFHDFDGNINSGMFSEDGDDDDLEGDSFDNDDDIKANMDEDDEYDEANDDDDLDNDSFNC